MTSIVRSLFTTEQNALSGVGSVPYHVFFVFAPGFWLIQRVDRVMGFADSRA